MATITLNSDGNVSLGNLRAELITITPTASDYATGGYALVAANVGMAKIVGALPIGGQGGLLPVYNPTTAKVQILGPGAPDGVPLSLGPLSATSTLSAVVSGVGTVTIANTLKAGQFVCLKSFTQLGALNGTIVQVATASATQFTFNLGSAANVTSGADTTGTYQVVQAGTGNLLQLGTVANITNSLSTSSLLTMTCANTFIPGQFVVIQGLTNGATSNGVIVQILTASTTQFTAIWTGTSFTTAADVGTATLLVTAGNAPIQTVNAVSITNSLATASSAGTAGVITLTAINGFAPNSVVVVSNMTNGAGANGDVLVVNQTSLTAKIFVSNHQNAGFTTAADTGVAAPVVTGVPPAGIGSAGTEMEANTDLSAFAFQLLVFGL